MFLSTLFAKLSHKEASKSFEKFVKKTELDGMPSISIRKKHNFNTTIIVNSECSSYIVDSTLNGYTVNFNFVYSNNYKSINCIISFPNLNVIAKYKKMIIDKYKNFTFDFCSNDESSITIIKYEKNIKSKNEFDTILQNFRREWNSSGLYKLLMDVRKV